MSSIERPCHPLKGEKTLSIPRHFIFFDTETDQIRNDDGTVTQRLKLGWACYYRRSYGRHLESTEWFYFETAEQFWEFALSKTAKKQKLWVIARNVVFDFTVVEGWKHLRKAKYKVKFFHNTGVCVILSLRLSNKSIVFLDSMNWFTESLEKTGERIGLPKMKIDFETCSKEELSTYCKNDTLIELENFKLFIEFLQTNQVSRLCYTKASTAMAAYLLNHYHKTIYIHNNAEAVSLEREAYMGGRCEAFYLGDLKHETFYIVDINSMYPFVMANQSYPTKYQNLIREPSIHDLTDMVEGKTAIAKVQLNTANPAYAIKRKRTIFPVGTFTASLCTPELRYALNNNDILHCDLVVTYESGDIFKSYVNTMYSMRQKYRKENNEQFHVLCKYLLNSLYGKFGQKAENWEKIGKAPDEPDRDETILAPSPPYVRRLRYLLGEVFEMKGYSEAFDSFPGIAAHVTAYGRMYLWKLINEAGRENVFYCDTDSLLVNRLGLERLQPYMDNTKLGYLKLEKQSNNVIIRGLKDYTFGETTKVKGVRRGAKKLSDGVYEQEQWSTFRGLLRSNDPNTYKVKKMVKHLTREYTKGKVLDNGKIIPFILEEN